MRSLTQLKRLMVSAFFSLVILCGNGLAHTVNVYINCEGSVDISADAYPSSSFGYGTLELWTTGPGYSTYKSTSGIGGLWLPEGQSFSYNSYYTATACAYFEDDNGNWYGCAYADCTSPAGPKE